MLMLIEIINDNNTIAMSKTITMKMTDDYDYDDNDYDEDGNDQ